MKIVQRDTVVVVPMLHMMLTVRIYRDAGAVAEVPALLNMSLESG